MKWALLVFEYYFVTQYGQQNTYDNMEQGSLTSCCDYLTYTCNDHYIKTICCPSQYKCDTYHTNVKYIIQMSYISYNTYMYAEENIEQRRVETARFA